MIDTKISNKASPADLSLVAVSRERFNRWAGYGGDADAPEHIVTDLERLQLKLGRWEINNFGLQPTWSSVLGVFEELGELEEATKDADVLDAVGDIAVFSSNLLYKNRMSVSPLFDSVKEMFVTDKSNLSLESRVIVSIGHLSHVMLKSVQRIRGYDDSEVTRRDLCLSLLPLLSYATRSAVMVGEDLTSCYQRVGKQVLLRDWKRNPTDAHKIFGGA